MQASWLSSGRHRRALIGLEAGRFKSARRPPMLASVATILVVDDDPVAADLVVAALTRAGHLVHTHDSGFGLAVAIHRCRPDLVVLDVCMPGLSGYQALKAARALDPSYGIKASVLLHSGLPEIELAEIAERVGARGYICKPALLSVIVDAVRNCLDETLARTATE
jgi:DNA-binding NtrC family response regulator